MSIPPIHRAGWPFVAAFAAAAVGLGALAWPLGVAGGALTLWCAWFFRDPERRTPAEPGAIVSPADGVVQSVTPARPPAELGLGDGPWTRVSVFMNVFDVHVNRAPMAGRVVRLAYRPGAFVNASFDKASEKNERHGMVLAADDGTEIGVVQIAGLVARRILCWAAEGRTLAAGERYGMIRFGSRLDVFLPAGVEPRVREGERARAGETVIAGVVRGEARGAAQ